MPWFRCHAKEIEGGRRRKKDAYPIVTAVVEGNTVGVECHFSNHGRIGFVGNELAQPGKSVLQDLDQQKHLFFVRVHFEVLESLEMVGQGVFFAVGVSVILASTMHLVGLLLGRVSAYIQFLRLGGQLARNEAGG